MGGSECSWNLSAIGPALSPGLSHDKGSEGVQGLFAHVACCV